MRLVLKEKEGKSGAAKSQEPDKPAANPRLREGMHGTDNPAARQESTKDRKPKRGEDQPHVPHLQHPALLLHHYGMQEGRPRQPRHQRSVLHRIPAPVTTPAQHRICPMRPQENAAGEKSPGHHRPAARDVDPLFTRIAHRERPQRKGEWHREPYIPEVQHRRMNHHLGILQ